jgi:hypothetical protein
LCYFFFQGYFEGNRTGTRRRTATSVLCYFFFQGYFEGNRTRRRTSTSVLCYFFFQGYRTLLEGNRTRRRPSTSQRRNEKAEQKRFVLQEEEHRHQNEGLFYKKKNIDIKTKKWGQKAERNKAVCNQFDT